MKRFRSTRSSNRFPEQRERKTRQAEAIALNEKTIQRALAASNRKARDRAMKKSIQARLMNRDGAKLGERMRVAISAPAINPSSRENVFE